MNLEQKINFMHISINDNTTCKEVQDVFSDHYPYLQIRFFRNAHKKYESSPVGEMVVSGMTIGKFKKTHVSGIIEILPIYKVAEVEREFLDRFGLSVQILRKEKDHWEQTTGMDEFTLKALNEMVKEKDAYIAQLKGSSRITSTPSASDSQKPRMSISEGLANKLARFSPQGRVTV